MPKVADYYACKQVGDFFFTPPNEKGERILSFRCPCGCNALAAVKVRVDGTQTDGAWGWNKDEEKPTVTPSIRINNTEWHGYLTDGVFKSC